MSLYCKDPNWNGSESLEDLPLRLRDEISHVLSIHKTPEGKVVKVDGRFWRDPALAEIDAARLRWAERGHRSRAGAPS